MSKWNGIEVESINRIPDPKDPKEEEVGPDGTKKKKKKSKGGKGDKEKPLLTVQGVLRLQHSFVQAQHKDAEIIIVHKPGQDEPEEMRLVPGGGEHENVSYKTGYDNQMQNPFPENKEEEKTYVERKKIEVVDDAFEEMKKQSEIDKKEKEAKWRKIPENELMPPGDDDDNVITEPLSKKPEVPKIDPEELDPNNPKNYILPPELADQNESEEIPMETDQDVATEVQTSGNEEAAKVPEEVPEKVPAKVSMKIPAKVSMKIPAKEKPKLVEDWSNDNSQDAFELNEEEKNMIPTMKPLPDEQEFGKDMVLSVALEHESKRRSKKRKKEEIAEDLDAEEDDSNDAVEDNNIYSLDELTKIKSVEQEEKAGKAGPSADQEELIKAKAEEENKALTEAYWEFVKSNPHDFNGWTYLLQHVERIDLLDDIRTAYNPFLELYPYCFAYWIRYSEIEKRHGDWDRALQILERALEAIPRSVDLWVAYLELYHKRYQETEIDDFNRIFREQCEKAIMTVGLDFKSDVLWERYLEWEHERRNLQYMTDIYSRLSCVPTKLFNKHWDNLIAHVRDHHPRDILDYENYDRLRRFTCKELNLTYRPDPIMEPNKIREVFLPEDKLKAGMKERIVASLVTNHEKCEDEVQMRIKFESKIKRPYFHVKPLDLKQLKNWSAYIDFEIEQGDHERIVVLFERCLIPCAKYEEFWIKYAQYLENYHNTGGMSLLTGGWTGVLDKKSSKKSFKNSALHLKKARWSFKTGLTNVDDIRERKAMWTLRGWKENDEDGNEIMVAEEIPIPKERQAEKESDSKEQKSSEDQENDKNDENVENVAEDENSDATMPTVGKKSENDEKDAIKGPHSVREVYQRGCGIHCPDKALICMKFAEFEESYGNTEAAKKTLDELIKRYPLLIEATMHLIDIERRARNSDNVEKLYKKLMKEIPKNRKSLRNWISMKMARFQYKVADKPDEALKTLRSAIKKGDPSDPRIYSQIVEIMYQKLGKPSDDEESIEKYEMNTRQLFATIEYALQAKELTNMQKLSFVKRKLELTQEFGNIRQFREVSVQLKTYKALCVTELKEEAKKRKELEREEMRLKEIEELRAQTKANANLKAKMAEAEGKLLCNQCQTSMFPNAEGFYEFEGFHPVHNPKMDPSKAEKPKKKAKDDDEDDDGIIDLMDMEIPDDQEEVIKKTLEEKTKYKEVAPTWELNIETYGYGKQRKVFDPDYEHVESSKFKEYERLEIDGYDEDLKDEDGGIRKLAPRTGLGHHKIPKKLKTAGDYETEAERLKAKFLTSDYVVPPKVPQLQLGPSIGPSRPYEGEEGAEAQDVFELPPEMANPQKTPCVNVPEWFVKEGGELCLSDTKNGLSIIRYWPKFLSERGNALMFKRLRKYCKWHQKQIKIGGEWKYETRLVAWYGPCDYTHSGLDLKKNPNWAPELLDLLHRLVGMTKTDFNTCFANLYRHGHDMCGWHSDTHPQLGKNPSVASVSLGAVRVFEFRRKNGPPNFIRFPLFPGSLLVMEGATQEDWLHCLPRDVNCKEERINLTFRTMYNIGKRD